MPHKYVFDYILMDDGFAHVENEENSNPPRMRMYYARSRVGASVCAMYADF